MHSRRSGRRAKSRQNRPYTAVVRVRAERNTPSRLCGLFVVVLIVAAAVASGGEATISGQSAQSHNASLLVGKESFALSSQSPGESKCPKSGEKLVVCVSMTATSCAKKPIVQRQLDSKTMATIQFAERPLHVSVSMFPRNPRGILDVRSGSFARVFTPPHGQSRLGRLIRFRLVSGQVVDVAATYSSTAFGSYFYRFCTA